MTLIRLGSRSKTLKEWNTENPILCKSEIAIVTNPSGHSAIKIGDGVNHFKDLPLLGMHQVTEDGGEIFNDYENNKALAKHSTTMGRGTISNKAKIPLDISIIKGNNFMEKTPSFDVLGKDVSKIKVGDVLFGEITFKDYREGVENPINSGTKEYKVTILKIEDRKSFIRLDIDNYPLVGEYAEIIESKVYFTYGPQFTRGIYNIEDSSNEYLDMVGNGTTDEHRSNAYTLDGWGNGWFKNGVSAGFADKAFQTPLSQSGAKVFKFAEHTYTQDDWNKKRYYLTYVTNNMLMKPFSIVLGENYDFLGTITNVVHNTSGEGGYIEVDNYKKPNDLNSKGEIDTKTKIYENSYILLPYDRVDASDDYTWNSQYVNEGAHLLGNDIIGAGSAAFGEDCHSLAIGSISAGLSNISAGKYSGTFGRYNVTGYCDFALGQNMKILGHWNAGFGRDNFIATTSDYSIVSGLRNEIYNKYCTAFGRGHVMKMEDTNARGRYSETDNDRRYVDRVGYGSSDNDRKNIYTLDKEGNVWFRGNVKVGGTNYDNASNLSNNTTFYSVDSIDEMIALNAKPGEMTLYNSLIYECDFNTLYGNGALQVWLEHNHHIDNAYITTDAYTEYSVVNGKCCRKFGYINDKNRYLYFMIPELTDTTQNMEISITYLDKGTHRIQLNGPNDSLIQLANSGKWKTKHFIVSNYMLKKQFNSYHFKIGAIGPVGQSKTPQTAYISNIACRVLRNSSGKFPLPITSEIFMKLPEQASDNGIPYYPWVRINDIN